MERYQCLSISVLLIACFLFVQVEASGQNSVLRELAKEDQDSRRGKNIARTDADRIKIVLALIGQGQVNTPEDKHNAALVLQHTGLTFCDQRLISFSPDNYLLAHNLFKSAFEAGYKNSRSLVAASLDRYLSFTEGYQRYGTNRVNNPETGKEERVPIDRKTADAERAKYAVPPLSELLKQFPEQAPRKKP